MILIAAFYRFTPFADPAAACMEVEASCRAHGVRGTVLLAPEGINGTVAGPPEGVRAVLADLRTLPGCAGMTHAESHAETLPFARLRVRPKREIVTMGQPHVAPARRTGRRVGPQDWNALIAAPDVVSIDTRNDYETALGSFAGAMRPAIGSFRAFPDWWQAHKASFAGKRVAMFCTGGIRCEKATAYLLADGAEAVFHLDGGILGYLDRIPEPESRWRGQCYVFDARVSVGAGLVPGQHTTCHACRRPLAPADRESPVFEAGVCCLLCHGEHDEPARARFRERQRQIALADARGERHLGGRAPL